MSLQSNNHANMMKLRKVIKVQSLRIEELETKNKPEVETKVNDLGIEEAVDPAPEKKKRSPRRKRLS